MPKSTNCYEKNWFGYIFPCPPAKAHCTGCNFDMVLPCDTFAFDKTSQDIVHANAAGAYWKAFLGFDRQRAQIIDTVSDEHESGIGGIKFFVGLLDDDAFHVHLPSEFV